MAYDPETYQYIPDEPALSIDDPRADVPAQEAQVPQTDYGSSGWLQPFMDAVNEITNSVSTPSSTSSPDMDAGASSVRSVLTKQDDSWGSSISKMLGEWLKTDQGKAQAVTLAGSFAKGLFGYAGEKEKNKATMMSAEANMLRAQSEAAAQATKFANASALGKTNFGAPLTGVLYRDKLATRRQRSLA